MGQHEDEARDDDDEIEIDRQAILARRRRFVAATLTGLTTSTLATACPCLKMAPSDAPPPEPDGAAEQEAEAQEEAAEQEAAQDDGDSVEEASPAEGEIPEDVGEPQ